MLCSDPYDSSLCSLVHFPQGPFANFLMPPPTLEKKKKVPPNHLPPPALGKQVSQLPSPHFTPFPSASKVEPPAHQAPGFGFSGWWWTQSGCLSWLYRVVSGGWGASLKGPQPFQPWAYLGFSLPSPPCLCVRPTPQSRSAPVIAALPAPLTLTPSLLVSPHHPLSVSALGG